MALQEHDLTLSIFWRDQFKGERCTQAIQPLLKYRPMKYRTLNRGLTTTLDDLCRALFDRCVGSLTSPANHVTRSEDAGDRAYGL